MRNLVMVMHVENFLTSIIIIKFPYNARFDWLKQRTLSLIQRIRSAEKHSTASRVFPYTSFVLYRFLRALQQNRAQSRLLYLLNITLLQIKVF